MKKTSIFGYLIFVLTLLVALAMPSAATPINITMRTLQHGQGAVVEGKIIDAFNQSQDNVKVELIQGQWEQGYAQLRMAVISGNAPHLFLSHILKVVEMYEYYTPWDASPVGNLLKESKIDTANFQQDSLKMGHYKGHQYILPLDFHGLMFWYNKDIFKEVGLDPDPENFPDNMADFTAACNKIRDAGYHAYHAGANGPPRYFRRAWYTYYWQQGGELFDDGYNKATFNNEKGLKALQFLVDGIHRHKWNVVGSDGYKQFASGKLGILHAGNWFLPNVVKTGVDWGAYKVPNLFGKRYAWANSQGFVIPKQPEGTKKEIYLAAIEVMKYYLEHSYQWTIGSGMIAGWNPALKNPELTGSESWQKASRWIAEMGEEGALHFPIMHPKGSELENSLKVNIELAVNGKISPQEALDRSEEECNRILSKK